MRSFLGIIAFCGTAFVALVSAQTASIEVFAALAGCWEHNEKGSQITEMWMKPAGTSIFGTGRTVKNGKTVDFEFLRIEQRAEGIFYVAKPKANSIETPFKLKTASATEFVFENLQHDFPQRIIYKITGNLLTTRIEGTQNGKTMGFDFPMMRAMCK